MPQALPIIAAAIVVGAGYEGLTAFFILAASTLASGYLQKELAPNARSISDEQGLKINTASTQAPLPTIYGEKLVGGNRIFTETVGENKKILWIVDTLAEGECDSIAQVSGVDQVFLDDKLYNTFGGNVSYWFHSGSSNQTVDTNLSAAIPKWTDTLKHTCYIVWKITLDRDYFTSLPKRTVLLKGKKLYDFRDESTAWSDNIVLALYDYITNNRYGLGKSVSSIDAPSWTAAANYCDTKGWGINYGIGGEKAAIDIINDMKFLFRGDIGWYDGKFYLKYSDLNYESSVMNLTDSHIVRNSKGFAALSVSQPPKYNKPQGLRIKFTDPDKNHTIDDILIGDTLGEIKDLELLGTNDREHASIIGTYTLERLILDRTISGTFRDDAVKLEPGDIVTFSSTALSLSEQLMRVIQADINSDGLINLVLVYEDLTLYDDIYNITPENIYTCILPNKDDPVVAISNAAITEETYNFRLQTKTRLKVTFDSPANYPWFSHVEVWLSTDNINYDHRYTTTSDFNIDPVEEGVTYYVRLKTVSIFGHRTQDVDDYKIAKTVAGYVDEPSSLGSLEIIVNANNINLYSTKIEDPDIELYEFRLGSSWVGGLFLSALASPNLNLNGVKPGSHFFWCSPLSNNGLYGFYPQFAAATLIDPPDGWTLQNSFTCDYDGVGTHTDTEHTTYASEDYLQATHEDLNESWIMATGAWNDSGIWDDSGTWYTTYENPLSGNYLSPIYDVGTIDRYLCAIIAETVIIGIGGTWGDIIPSGVYWKDIGIQNRTWKDILEVTESSQVQIRLYYGDTSPPTNYVDKQEILSAIVSARYFQVKITITDSSNEVNALVENFTLKLYQ